MTEHQIEVTAKKLGDPRKTVVFQTIKDEPKTLDYLRNRIAELKQDFNYPEVKGNPRLSKVILDAIKDLEEQIKDIEDGNIS